MMAWLAVLRRVCGDPVALALAFIVGTLCFAGGYFVGGDAKEDKQALEVAKGENKKLRQAIEHYAEWAENINETSNEYQAKLKKLHADYAASSGELDRLRIKPRNCPAIVTASTGKPDGTAEAGTDRNGTGEINLDGVAQQIKQLGIDFDAANIHITELQTLVNQYRKACNFQ
jgi:hypothetical protein